MCKIYSRSQEKYRGSARGCIPLFYLAALVALAGWLIFALLLTFKLAPLNRRSENIRVNAYGGSGLTPTKIVAMVGSASSPGLGIVGFPPGLAPRAGSRNFGVAAMISSTKSSAPAVVDTKKPTPTDPTVVYVIRLSNGFIPARS